MAMRLKSEDFEAKKHFADPLWTGIKMKEHTLLTTSNIDVDDTTEFLLQNRRNGMQGRPFLNMIVALCILISLGLFFEIIGYGGRPSFDIAVNMNMQQELTDYISSPYTESVRENVKKLMENRTTVLYQFRNDTIRPFLNKMAKYTTASLYGLSHCFVPKVMATTQQGFFCYLRDSKGFEKAGLDLKTVYWGNEFCGSSGTVYQTAELLDYLPPQHLTFQMTRDPLKRFVSAFVNKCVVERRQRATYNDTRETCYGCNEDIKCVVKKLYTETFVISRVNRQLQQRYNFKDYYTEHFMPLTWYCDLARRSTDIEYIRYVSSGAKKIEMASEIIKIMRKGGVEEEKLTKMKEVLLDDEPLTHATKGTDLPEKYMEEILKDKKILETLRKIYYYDFIVFDYPMPQ